MAPEFSVENEVNLAVEYRDIRARFNDVLGEKTKPAALKIRARDSNLDTRYKTRRVVPTRSYGRVPR